HADDATHHPRAGASPRAWALFLVLTALLTAADLATKSLSFARVADVPVVVDKADALELMRTQPQALNALIPIHDPVVVAPYILEFKLVLNPGAVFGTGPGKRWFFIGFTIVALVVAVVMFARATTRNQWLTHTGIALIVSGGAGNLYDRLVFACVRDFIHPLPGVTWPGSTREVWPYVSNVADAFLLIGIGIVMVKLWRHEREVVKSQKNDDAPGDGHTPDQPASR
ncbi:MAG: signal peptidase II, partial [Planctomycetota bacterium]